jgi:hypothetical protein
MIFPAYDRLGRYRPGCRIGPIHVEWSPDHLPWPQVSVFRGGTYIEFGFQIGPLGPDPVFAAYVRIPRP